MNKKMLMLLFLVLVPSFAFAGLLRSPELCAVIAEKVESGMSQADIESDINGNDRIDKSMMNDLPKLVLATRMGRAMRNGQREFGVSGCRSELASQLRNARNRTGAAPASPTGSGTGGAASGVAAAGLVAGAEAGLGIQKETDNIREGMPAFANGSTDDEALHQMGLTLSGQCDVLADTETICLLPSPGSIGIITPVFDFVSKSELEKRPKDDQHCSCIEGKVNKEYANAQVRETRLATEKSDLKKLVIENFGKKFINNFSAHLEDVRYFSVNAKNAFSSNPGSQTAEALKVQCSDPAEFRAAIQTKCGNTLSQSDLEKRMDGIFSLLNEKNKGLNYIERLTDRVMINTAPGSKLFYRHDYDYMRNGLVHRDKKIKFVDKLVAEVLKDKNAVKKIQESVSLGGKLPYDGLMDYIALELQTNNSGFSRRFLDKDLLGKEKYEQLSRMFANSANAMVAISKVIDYAMEVHPGLDNLLKKGDLFSEAASKIKRGNKSAIEFLENDETLMKPRFAAECNRLKEELAQVVCTKEDEILQSVGKNELRHLIKETGRKEDLLLIDQVICKNGNINQDNGAFTELSLEPSDRKADVLERMAVDDITKHKNLFSKLMLENLKPTNAETQRFFADVAREGYINRSGIVGDTFVSKFDSKGGNKISFLSQETMDQIDNGSLDEKGAAAMANAATNTNSNNINNTQPEMTPQMAPSYVSNYVAPVAAVPQDAGKTNSSNAADMRSDLREFLSNREDKESVDRLMRNTDDGQLAELAKLREETQRNREQLLELQNENEKLKLRQMQDQIAELEEKRAKAVGTNIVQTQTTDEESDQRSSGRGSRDIASVSSGETNGASTGNFSTGSTGNSGAVTGGGSSTGPGRSGGLSSLRNELAASGVPGLDGGSSDPVVISAGQARTGALEVRSSELSNEVLSFLETEPDVQTLIKMRKSGMIYKYKVVENGAEVVKEIAIDYGTLNADIKKIIDQKIADSGRAGSEAQRLSTEIRNLRRTYSYNALRMIIGQPVRK